MIPERLPESTVLLYSELLQQCWQVAPEGRGISFVKKMLKDRLYWYMQITIGAVKTQHYLGPDSPELREKIASERHLWETIKPELQKRKKLIAMAAAGGAYTVEHGTARVLEVLERAGVFLVGGVLVGSQAFRLYANMLGFRWNLDAVQTMDMDIAGDNRLTLAIKDKVVDLKSALLDSGMGFFEIPTLNPKHPSSRFAVRGKQLQVDVLTPMVGPTNSKPIYLKSLNTAATPIRFLDFLLEDIQTAVVVAKAGILVNVPAPSRYALHKLVLSQRRPPALQTKARKDLLQAEQLMSVLLEERPGDLQMALEAADTQPGKFMQQLRQGFARLDRRIQELFRQEVLADRSW